MRKAASFILLLIATVSMIYGQTTVKSTIKTAQVYTQGAQIDREASVSLKPGKNEFKINLLSANLDPNT